MTVAVRLIRFALLCAFPLSGLSMGGGSVGGSDWRYFVAGGVSAASSHGLTTPIDVVKTRIQLDPQKYGDGNVLAAAKDIIATDGIGMLAQGLAPTVVGYGIEGALKFGTFRRILHA